MLHRHRLNLSWAIGALLLLSPVACTSASTSPPMATEIVGDADFAEDEAFQSLVNADVVYLGEVHDRLADHEAQLAIISALYAENPDLAIAMEMFQRPFQGAIDRYLAGDISEAELVAQTEYAQRWGFDWEYYAPILQFAQTHQLPVLALNAPSETVRQVSRHGLNSLEEDDYRYIPPLAEIDTSNQDYRAFVATAFEAHSAHGTFDLDRFFAAQVLWDETMATAVAEFIQTSPSTQVVVLAGSGHVIYGYGIPDRVERRLGEAVQQVTVLLNFPPEQLAQESNHVADVLWYSE